MKRDVVFGTGQVGRHVVAHLVELGRDVVAVNRSGRGDFPGAEVVGGDVTNDVFTKEVTRDATPVYFCLNASNYHRWPQEFPPLQDAVVRWLPKVSLEFDALFNEPTHFSAFTNFRAPVLIIRGEHAPPPTRLIADRLPSIFPDARQAVVAGAGHMGPITHADAVNALIVAHIEDAPASVSAARRI